MSQGYFYCPECKWDFQLRTARSEEHHYASKTHQARAEANRVKKCEVCGRWVTPSKWDAHPNTPGHQRILAAHQTRAERPVGSPPRKLSPKAKRLMDLYNTAMLEKRTGGAG